MGSIADLRIAGDDSSEYQQSVVCLKLEFDGSIDGKRKHSLDVAAQETEVRSGAAIGRVVVLEMEFHRDLHLDARIFSAFGRRGHDRSPTVSLSSDGKYSRASALGRLYGGFILRVIPTRYFLRGFRD